MLIQLMIRFRIQMILAKQKRCSQIKSTIVLLNFLINASKLPTHRIQI